MNLSCLGLALLLSGLYSSISNLAHCQTLDIQRKCHCGLENKTVSVLQLFCQMDPLNLSNPYGYVIPCQQVNDLVRIGPIDSDYQYTPVLDTNSIQLAPWAFDGLMWDRTVSRLQLDLQLTEYDVTALSLGGLERLQELLTRTSYIRWNACSLAGLIRVRQVLLSCRSKFDEFLTLGPNVEVIRFVDCDQAPIQFYCITCIQDPSIHVIRVRPGPPLRQYMVKFTQFNRTTNQSGTNEQKDRLSLGRCVPNICSDSMLCRDDHALEMVQKNVNRPIPPRTLPVLTMTTPTTTTTTTVITFNSTTVVDTVHAVALDSNLMESKLRLSKTNILSDNLSNASLFSNQNDPASTTSHYQYHSPSSVTYGPTKSNNENVLTRGQRIWIAASIVSVIAVFLITACVLIGILRQRSSSSSGVRQSIKYGRPRRAHQTKYTNGVIRDPIEEDENGKLELPERVC